MNKNEYVIRHMTRSELDVAVSWANNEGWNPGLYDAEIFWDTDPKGFLAMEKDEEMIGSVSGISYGGNFGFGGFFIIKPEFRGQGLGKELANYFLKELQNRLNKEASIGIDGVFEMQPTYRKWGFVFSHRNLRMESIAKSFTHNTNISEIKSTDWEQVRELDKECFGFDREAFLNKWLKMKDSKAIKYVKDNKLQGYGVIRKCTEGYKIGPLFAVKLEVADALFKELSTFATGEKVYLDVPEINKNAIKISKKYNMNEVFGCARMYKGTAPSLSYEKIYGVTTFELG